MAEPTLKDVLTAITELRKGQARLEEGQEEIRSTMATKADVDALRADMKERFDELDAELTLHARVHRKIEHDLTALKGRPPRTGARPARRPRAR